MDVDIYYLDYATMISDIIVVFPWKYHGWGAINAIP